MFPPELRKKPGQNLVNGKELILNDDNEVSLYAALSKHVLTEEQLVSEGYPRRKKDTKLAYINKEYLTRYNKKKNNPAPPRGEFSCSKCSKNFCVDNRGLSTDVKGCNYHSKSSMCTRVVRGNYIKLHNCCFQEPDNPCMYSKYHSVELADFQNLEGFKETEEPMGLEPEEGWGVYAVDCEMYWSTTGLELGRVSVVNADQRCIYDAFVKPIKPVTDYSTKFSGLTEENLSSSNTSFEDVQNTMLKLFNKKTILIGHSLENDLRALKIIHSNVVDTSVIYTKLGRKVALKHLAKEELNEKIQDGECNGHDSYEDANTCLKLMLKKVFQTAVQDAKKKPPIKRPPHVPKDIGFC